MKLLLPILVIVTFVTSTFLGIAQTTQSNLNSTEQKVTQLLSEVYMNCPQYVDNYNISNGVEFLSRVVYHEVAADQYPQCLLLSSVDLKNKCNPTLTYDSNDFNPETFNPFKYLFKFYSPEVAYFRVDGTNYIIEIKPTN